MTCTPYIMQSNCGVDTVKSARQIPITMIESGPASGIWGAAALGRLIGEPDVIAIDIGGTTAKCGLITGGQVKLNTNYWSSAARLSAGYPIMVPVVDLVEIGNGGGSIAWVDDFAGCTSARRARARCPGPVSYGAGGTEATTTDANLALGRINPNYFCGGTLMADMPAVDAALDRLAADAGTSPAGGGARHRPHRQQQHGQRHQADLGEPRPRPARLHARRVRRRRRHARLRAGEGAGHQEGGHPEPVRRLLGLGHAAQRPAPRLPADADRGD